MNEYLAIASGGYLYTNSFRALIAVWMDTREVEVVVRLNRSARELSVPRFDLSR